ncbi:shikimate dehydrogenase family protein [Catellatospora vulcania]|uniref:shikimate dehydrogenase family protein n=1 Tax=Catellatospora vulcania TaxID=1460450 RepID=UPI0012D460FC|nr:NAD(P)-binding domain-containing protein [Catellatospora vulcania]
MPEPPPISGTTRLYAVLGDPIAQVQAPTLVNELFQAAGRDAALVPMHVTPEGLAEALAGLARLANLDGLLVTVPHKAAVARLASAVSPTVAITGTANALRRQPGGGWYAANFDGDGFIRGLRAQGHEPAGRTIALIGAGGAGSAIAAALLDAGADRLTLTDTNPARARDLASRLADSRPGRVHTTVTPALADADVAVNATPLGMAPGDPLPFAPHELPPGALVADIVMHPADTPLLRAAAALGHRVHQGHHMLRHQLDAYRDFFGW